MKIIMITRLFYPHQGGVERHVEEISEQAVKEGHNVVIVTGQHNPSLAYESRLLNSSSEKLSIKRISSLYEKNQLRKIEKLRQRIHIWIWMIFNIRIFWEADIVHIHDVFWWYWIVRVLLPWKKVYITFHGFEAGKLPTHKAIRARRIAEILTRGNICVGAWIEKWYGTKPTFITYGAGNGSTYKRNPSQPSKSKNLFHAAFIGRLDDDTGVLEYAKVVSSLRNWQLDVYGAGERKTNLPRLAKDSRNIRVLGTTNNSYATFALYDVACVSSYLSILEAMQSRIPVIAYATDELKKDYLSCHPAAQHMYIVDSREQLENLLKNWDKNEADRKAQCAFQWAKTQTWKNLFNTYKKLWSL